MYLLITSYLPQCDGRHIIWPQNAISAIRVHDTLAGGADSAAAARLATPVSQSNASAEPVAKTPKPPQAAAPAAKPPSDAQVISDLRAQLEAAKRDAEAALREAASAKESAGHELVLLRKDLNKAHASLAEANKGLEDAKVSLSREREKVMKLEAEAAELQKKLGAASELQKEVEALRRVVKETEAKKGSGGVWGYISGQ